MFDMNHTGQFPAVKVSLLQKREKQFSRAYSSIIIVCTQAGFERLEEFLREFAISQLL
jgi:hypothetical protein